MPMIAGGCLCGAVRYRSQAEPVMQVICHCKTCQKNSGSAFSMNVAVPQDTLELDGDEPRRYEDRSGSSGQPFYRQYCGRCGSHVYSHGAAYGALAVTRSMAISQLLAFTRARDRTARGTSRQERRLPVEPCDGIS